jgi:hypothetical protein
MMHVQPMDPLQGRRKTGLWIAYAGMAMTLAPSTFFFMGGLRALAVVLILSYMIMTSDNTNGLFLRSIAQFWTRDPLVWVLYLWFMAGVFAGIVRNGEDWNIWLTISLSVLALHYGQFLSRHWSMRPMAVWTGMAILSAHGVLSLRWITGGTNIRGALHDSIRTGMDLGYGHTDTWGAIAIFLPIALAEMFRERRLPLKLGGALAIAVCAYCVLYSGFAVPTAMLLLGGLLFGVLLLVYGRRTGVPVAVRGCIALLLMGAAVYGVRVVLTSYDTRLQDASKRFARLIEDPESGGYAGSGEQSSRLAMARYSWEKFRERPYFGWGGDIRNNRVTLGHNSFFDYLADYGLLGGGGAFALLVLTMIARSARTLRREKSTEAIGHCVASILFLVIGMANPCWISTPAVVIFLYGRFYHATPPVYLVPVAAAPPVPRFPRPAAAGRRS